jgi:hypothetical protein
MFDLIPRLAGQPLLQDALIRMKSAGSPSTA